MPSTHGQTIEIHIAGSKPKPKEHKHKPKDHKYLPATHVVKTEKFLNKDGKLVKKVVTEYAAKKKKWECETTNHQSRRTRNVL